MCNSVKRLLFIILVLFSYCAYGQKVQFDQNGSLVNGMDHLKTGVTPDYQTDALDTMNAAIKKDFKKILQKNLQMAFNVLSDTSIPDVNAYSRFWAEPEFEQLKKDLKTIHDQLSTDPFTLSLSDTSDLYILEHLIKGYLDNSWKFYKTSYSEGKKAFEISLTTVDLVNDFMIKYYNSIYQQPANAVFTQLNADSYLEIIKQLSSIQQDLKDGIAKADKSVTIATLNEGYALGVKTKEQLSNNLIFNLLNAPWSRSWIWKTGGYVLLNPLPFTVDGFPKVDSTVDEKKADYYKRYVESSLEKRIAKDSIRDIPSFKNDLEHFGKEKELYTDFSNRKKTSENNAAERKKLLLVNRIINKVKIPIIVGDALYLSYLTPNDEDKDLRQLQALSIDQKLVFTVHNLHKGQSASLVKRKAIVIKDQSDVQVAIDEGLNQIAKIAMALQPVSGIAGNIIEALNAPYKLVGGVGKMTAMPLVPFADAGSPWAKYEYKGKIRFSRIEDIDSFWNATRVALKNTIIFQLNALNPDYQFMNLRELQNISFSEGVFERIKSQYTVTVAGLYIPAKASEETIQKVYKEITELYFKRFLEEIVAPILYGVLKDYYRDVQVALQIVEKSTLPPALLKADSDKEAVYHSEIHYTETEDSTKKYEYELISIKDKDSLTFGRVGFSTSKRRRIQFSAGLVYTITPAIRNNVSEENGQIKVTSHEQRYGMSVALHFYPFDGGLFVQDKEFIAGKKYGVANRINFMLGVSIPQPLENILFGVGYDFGPGLKLNTGVHFYRYDKFEVLNNTITNKSMVYRVTGPFVSLGIDPASLVKALNIFNK